jgi:hypothetical protein
MDLTHQVEKQMREEDVEQECVAEEPGKEERLWKEEWMRRRTCLFCSQCLVLSSRDERPHHGR